MKTGDFEQFGKIFDFYIFLMGCPEIWGKQFLVESVVAIALSDVPGL